MARFTEYSKGKKCSSSITTFLSLKYLFLANIYFLKEIFLFKFNYSFIFREKGREGEREGEKRQCVVATCVPPTGDLAQNPAMFPDWELNQ